MSRPEVQPDRCANHPDRETFVHCSNCGKPICTDCMVYTAVGIKCRECAKLPRSALIAMTPERWARAVAAAVAAGTAVGFAYYLLLSGVGFFFFAFFVGAGIGYLVGEAVFRASGYFHGLETALVAIGGTLWAFVFPPLFASVVRFGLSWDAVVFSVSRGAVANWIVMAIAGYVAYQRNR